MTAIPIFVSSTFVDFHVERDVIRGRVREQLDELVAEFGHRIEIIDLRSGIEALQDTGQQERHVLDICLGEIDRSRPLFLGLVGHRGGLVPEASHAQWAAVCAGHGETLGIDALSITGLEISHAALWPNAPMGHHVILLRDIDGSPPDGWTDADPDHIATFRARLEGAARERSDLTVASYRVGLEGGRPVLRDVAIPGGFTDFEDWVVGLLSPGVLDRVRELSEAAATTSARERLFRDERRVVAGREATLTALRERLARGERVVLTGPSGSGKSTIACKISDPKDEKPVAAWLLGAEPDARDSASVMHALARQVSLLAGLADLARDLPPDEAQSLWRGQLSEAVGRLGSLTLVVDGLDLLGAASSPSDTRLFGQLPDGVGALVTTTDIAQARRLEAIGFQVEHLAPLSPAAVRYMLGPAGGRRDTRGFPAKVVDRLAALPRLPLWVHMATDVLVDLNVEDFEAAPATKNWSDKVTRLLETRLEAVPDDETALAATLLGRVGGRVGPEIAHLVLGWLATSRSGLTTDDLAHMLASEVGDTDAARVLVAHTRRVLGSQLVLDATGRMSFHHGLMRAAAAHDAEESMHLLIARRLADTGAADAPARLDIVWHSMRTGAALDRDDVIALCSALNCADEGVTEVLAEAIARAGIAALPVLYGLGFRGLDQTGLREVLAAVEMVDDPWRSPLPHTLIEQLWKVVGALAEVTQVSTLLSESEQPLADQVVDTLGLTALPDGVRVEQYMVRWPNTVNAFVTKIGRAEVALATGEYETASTLIEDALADVRRHGETGTAYYLSLGHHLLGRVGEEVGVGDRGLANDEKALVYARRAAEDDPDDEDLRHLSLCLDSLARWHVDAGDVASGRPLFEESLSVARELARRNPDSEQHLRDLSISIENVGICCAKTGDDESALPLADEALGVARRMLVWQPSAVIAHTDVIDCLIQVGRIRERLGHKELARRCFAEAVTAAQQLDEVADAVTSARCKAVSHWSLARVLGALGDEISARRMFALSVYCHEVWIDAEPGMPQPRMNLADALADFAEFLEDKGDALAVTNRYAKAVTLYERLAVEFPDDPVHLRVAGRLIDRILALPWAVGPEVAQLRMRRRALHVKLAKIEMSAEAVTSWALLDRKLIDAIRAGELPHLSDPTPLWDEIADLLDKLSSAVELPPELAELRADAVRTSRGSE